MKKETELRNQLKAIRIRMGLSQQELATAAGVARQTIGGIESGSYALSLSVALHLAKTLGCPVEELFWLEDTLPTVEAVPIGSAGATADESVPGSVPIRVTLAQVGRKWVASPLWGTQGFRQEMIPADGVGVWDAHAERVSIRLLETPEVLTKTVLLAGCTPALSLWARSAERWHPGLRVNWLHASSMAALRHLARNEVHVAGIHLVNPETGADNFAYVREMLPGVPTVLVNLGVWEEGLVVAPGNPKGICSCSDLVAPAVRLVNREEGAGARLLLDGMLALADIAPSRVVGYADIVFGHLEVAQAVATGAADVGVSTAAVAAAFGLDFVPLRSVRYDLALRKESMQVPAVQQLLGTLHHRWVRSQLATLGGYDIAQTGEITDVSVSAT